MGKRIWCGVWLLFLATSALAGPPAEGDLYVTSGDPLGLLVALDAFADCHCQSDPLSDDSDCVPY